MRIKHLLAVSILAVSMMAMAQTGKGGTWTHQSHCHQKRTIYIWQ